MENPKRSTTISRGAGVACDHTRMTTEPTVNPTIEALEISQGKVTNDLTRTSSTSRICPLTGLAAVEVDPEVAVCALTSTRREIFSQETR